MKNTNLMHRIFRRPIETILKKQLDQAIDDRISYQLILKKRDGSLVEIVQNAQCVPFIGSTIRLNDFSHGTYSIQDVQFSRVCSTATLIVTQLEQ